MSANRKRHTYQQICIGLIFLYMIASIVWWYVELNHQALALHTAKIHHSLSSKSPMANILIQEDLKKDQLKFLGEGITFLIFIAIGWIALSWIVFKQYQITAQQKYFLELLAHETKTPITITKLQLQNLRKQYFSAENNNEPVPEISVSLAQMDYLNMMVNKFLVLLRLESRSKISPFFEKIDIGETLQECLNKMFEVFPHQKGNCIIHPSPQPMFILGDKVLLCLLFSNLVENAWKHSKSTQAVEITLLHEHHSVTIAIRDFGVGISPSLSKKMFKKSLVQTPSTIARTGVGLRIAQLICHYHKGTIRYQKMNVGSHFFIYLPSV